MDKITEEVITNLIKRVEALEQEKRVTPSQTQRGIPQATIGQINYVRGLGGNPWPGMTKKEASQLIDSLQKRKNVKPQKEEFKKEPDKTIFSKALTPEEIEEIGEESFL